MIILSLQTAVAFTLLALAAWMMTLAHRDWLIASVYTMRPVILVRARGNWYVSCLRLCSSAILAMVSAFNWHMGTRPGAPIWGRLLLLVFTCLLASKSIVEHVTYYKQAHLLHQELKKN